MLSPTRMPAAFLQLERNRRYWPLAAVPGGRATRSASRAASCSTQYFPGEGLQLHPLSTFKKANLIHGACERGEPSCDEAGAAAAARRDGPHWPSSAARSFIAWEYLLLLRRRHAALDQRHGARRPAIQAYGRAGAAARASRTTPTSPARALGAFETPPPLGVRTTGFARRRRTTSSTRSPRACTSSTPSCSR